jgi:hypothetical protein
LKSKYINFSIILIVLSVFDIITTQYALSTYPHLSEGNPLMALVTGSYALFLLVKAFGVMIIAGVYHKIKNQDNLIVKAGKATIIMMMLFVVGNNLIAIASATTSYGFPSPYELESPGRVEEDGSQSYAFIGHNNYNVTNYFTFNSTANGGLEYGAANTFYSNNMVRFAVLDWAHPYRMFLVFSNLDVAYTDSPSGVTYEAGYYADNVWPIPGCSNCNDLHKIGVLTQLNPQMSGFVDSEGNLFLAEGINLVEFVRSSDYTKITYLSVTNYTSTTYSQINGKTIGANILDMTLDDAGRIHFLIGTTVSIDNGYAVSGNVFLEDSVSVFATKTSVYNQTIYTRAYVSNGIGAQQYGVNSGSILAVSGSTRTAKEIIASYPNPTNIILQYSNTTTWIDICPTFCASITNTAGLQIYDGYAYISSATENKIYRFPTTIQASSGSGYVQGQGTESTDVPDISYTEKSINSLYANYYNTSKFSIQAKINFASGKWPTSVNYGINDQAYRWQIRLVDPNGVTVNSWDSGECDDSGLTHCELTILRDYLPPAIGWQAGTWYVKLYEHKIDSTLFGDAPSGNLALLTTSATWNVLNSSANNSGIINDPIESINSPSNLATITLIDNYVGLLGFGVNDISKLLFSLLIIAILFIVGLIYAKNGMIGFALASIPYVFFTYISYIPKWIFIVYIITLIIIAKVFR